MSGGAGTAGGCNCGTEQAPSQPQATSQSGQQRQPGLESSATVSGESMTEAVASLFAPGTLDRQDALLLWTGVNTLLFATIVYLEVTDR